MVVVVVVVVMVGVVVGGGAGSSNGGGGVAVGGNFVVVGGVCGCCAPHTIYQNDSYGIREKISSYTLWAVITQVVGHIQYSYMLLAK